MAHRDHTIAVVDDDPGVRKALERLLSVLGYRVELFASAAEFLRSAATSSAECLIVDIRLGDECGLDLARRLFEASFRVPVVFITGSLDHTIRMRCMELGCVAFLQKPIAEARLMDAIAMALGLDLQTA